MPAKGGCSRVRRTAFQPMWGSRGAVRQALRPAGSTPSVAAPSSSLASKRSCIPRQMPRKGRSPVAHARMGVVRPRRARRAIAGAAAPTPGTMSPTAPSRSAARWRPRPPSGHAQRLVDADEVAGAVVDNGDSRSPEAPLGRRCAGPPRVCRHAVRRARARALKAASATWCRCVRWRAGAGSRRPPGRTPRGRCSTSCVGSVPTRSARKREVEDRVRPAADVDDRVGQRLVHGDGASPKRAMPARSPSASPTAAEHEGHVLDRVVLVDVEVARRPDVEVEEAVNARDDRRWS